MYLVDQCVLWLHCKEHANAIETSLSMRFPHAKLSISNKTIVSKHLIPGMDLGKSMIMRGCTMYNKRIIAN